MAAGKRYIRLKELAPGNDIEHWPTDKYLRLTDGSLGKGPFRARTDTDGFLMTGNDEIEAPPIIFMGGSFVESIYAEEKTRFVSQVERQLRARDASFRCLNAGYSGSTSIQLINALINKIVPLASSGGTVVYFVPQSDSDVVRIEGSYWNRTVRHAPIVPAGDKTAPEAACDFESTRAFLEVAVQVCKSFGIDLIIASSPIRDGSYLLDSYLRKKFQTKERFDQIQGIRRSLTQIPREFAEERGVQFIDCHAMLGGRGKYFYDDLHLNTAGHDTFARQLTTALLAYLQPGEQAQSVHHIKKHRRFARGLSWRAKEHEQL